MPGDFGLRQPGGTRDEALANVHEAIVLCLEVRAERGRPLTIEAAQVEGTVGWARCCRRPVAAMSCGPLQNVGGMLRGSGEKSGSHSTLSVPDHKEVAKGTLRSLMRSADLSVEDFLPLL